MRTAEKPRAPRRAVMIAARVRCRDAWSSATIRNVSTSGLLIAAKPAPPTGSYVEIRVGQCAVIARAVWSDGSQSGLKSQDPINIAALASARAAADAAYAASPKAERRAAPRPDPQAAAERSRARAQAFQFVVLGAGGIAAALGIGYEVFAMLASPLAMITDRL